MPIRSFSLTISLSSPFISPIDRRDKWEYCGDYLIEVINSDRVAADTSTDSMVQGA
jgi:hypothetical protein